MKLAELEPRFIVYRKETEAERFERGAATAGELIETRGIPFEKAQGLWFLCPLCFEKNKGPVGTHAVEVSFANRGVLEHQGSHNKEGKPVRWNVSGTDFANLSLTPSVLLQGGCNWHGFVTNGEIR